MTTIFGLFGAGGHGRETMQFARSAILRHQGPSVAQSRIVFVDDRMAGQAVDGVGVIREDEFFAAQSPRYFNVAISDGKIRERIWDLCISRGAIPLALIADVAQVSASGKIGEGAIFAPFSMSTSNATIGKSFHANMYSYVAHDCEIGDFVSFAPAVKCNGSVVVEDFATIGTGAILRQGTHDRPLRIGRGAVVGMGAVVTRDVPAGVTVVGNPARLLQKSS